MTRHRIVVDRESLIEALRPSFVPDDAHVELSASVVDVDASCIDDVLIDDIELEFIWQEDTHL